MQTDDPVKLSTASLARLGSLIAPFSSINWNDAEQIQAASIPLTRNAQPACGHTITATSSRIPISSPSPPTQEIFNDIGGAAVAYTNVLKVIAHSWAESDKVA